MTERLLYAGGSSIVQNAGDPCGVVLRLERTPATGTFLWAPTDGRAMELEVRARLATSSAGLGEQPMVRWYAEVGHGRLTRRVPPVPQQVISGNLHEQSVLPDRGMVLRVAARTLQLTFINAGLRAGAGNVDRIDVAISVQPVVGMTTPRFVREHYFEGDLAVFPAEATEWRLRQLLNALPFVLGTQQVSFFGLFGTLSLPNDATDYSGWTPIPPFAATWACSTSAIAEYR